VRFQDHIDVVSSVADSQGALLRKPVFDHKDDFCLLLWRDTAREHNVNVV
jgi:hypothetical protein